MWQQLFLLQKLWASPPITSSFITCKNHLFRKPHSSALRAMAPFHSSPVPATSSFLQSISTCQISLAFPQCCASLLLTEVKALQAETTRNRFVVGKVGFITCCNKGRMHTMANYGVSQKGMVERTYKIWACFR